jgi:hypothetical protein
MPKVVLPFLDKTVVLSFGDFDDIIDIDQLTTIDYSNLFGEAVTVSALMNRVGILKAEAEASLATKKLECDIYIAERSKIIRREANTNAGKFTIKDGQSDISIKLTEDSLVMAISLDIVVQNRRKGIIEAQKNLSFLDSLYWSIKSKDTKLSVLVNGVTPKEFYEELIEGTVNAIIIKKPRDSWTSEKK